MTNEEIMQRLKKILFRAGYQDREANAALFREATALVRERRADDILWGVKYRRRYKRHDLFVGQDLEGKWYWSATYRDTYNSLASGDALSLAAAQAAAMAWVDEQEGK